jgi:hypothetical protein
MILSSVGHICMAAGSFSWSCSPPIASNVVRIALRLAKLGAKSEKSLSVLGSLERAQLSNNPTLRPGQRVAVNAMAPAMINATTPIMRTTISAKCSPAARWG